MLARILQTLQIIYLFVFGDWGQLQNTTQVVVSSEKNVCESDCYFVAGLCSEVTMISAVT